MKRAALVLALVITAACGSLEGPRSGAVSPPTDALARWQNFPADRVPRPIVLLGVNPPGQGFNTNDEKIAALCSKFALATPLPPTLPAQGVASWVDGTTALFATTSAADAFARMTTEGKPASSPDCARVAPLQVTAIRLDKAAFTTDRGVAQMSAWLFKATGAWAEFASPAIAPSAFWKEAFSEASIGGGASVSASGRQLAFSFIGGPADGACAVDYTGVVAESPHAVAVAVQSNPGRTEAGPVACDAVGHMRSVTVTLASPLGGRVLVDASGAAVEACPEAIRSGCF